MADSESPCKDTLDGVDDTTDADEAAADFDAEETTE